MLHCPFCIKECLVIYFYSKAWFICKLTSQISIYFQFNFHVSSVLSAFYLLRNQVPAHIFRVPDGRLVLSAHFLQRPVIEQTWLLVNDATWLMVCGSVRCHISAPCACPVQVQMSFGHILTDRVVHQEYVWPLAQRWSVGLQQLLRVSFVRFNLIYLLAFLLLFCLYFWNKLLVICLKVGHHWAPVRIIVVLNCVVVLF